MMRGSENQRRQRMWCACRVAAIAVWALAVSPDVAHPAQPPRQVGDGPADAQVRRLDGGTAAPADTPLPDLLIYRIGGWAPNDPQGSLFTGMWATGADFFRLDLVFDGLVCPPGSDFPTNIFLFGDNPLLGFVELDVDDAVTSGGELIGPQFRYHGAAARFGGVPQAARFDGRVALDNCPGSFDADISTGPYFPERSGEEFNLAFLWGAVTTLDVGSNGDLIFEPGESWGVRGYFLNRAHGFDDFILVCCSNGLPSYSPEVDLRFEHSVLTDRTTVSLVYPLTQAGAAAITGTSPEILDCCADNQSSIEEALAHVVFSAQLATANDREGVNFPLIAPWEFQVAADYLDPLLWQVNAAFMGAFTDVDTLGVALAWTDIVPNVAMQDYNGDGAVDADDVALFDAFLAESDGDACDADGATNGVFTIQNFGDGFDVHDANYDGVVDAADRPVVPELAVGYDADNDGDVDLMDFAIMQRCASVATGVTLSASCERVDGNNDGIVDSADMIMFTEQFVGPRSFAFPRQTLEVDGWQAYP